MEDLKITLIQSNIHWQSVDANLAMFEEKLWSWRPETDLIVLPEMFNTGFTMETQKFAEPVNGKTFRWMKQMAGQFNTALTGSFIVGENNSYYNRLVWMSPDGKSSTYDKRHLFSMSGENEHFREGAGQLTIDLNGWKIRPFICYDLRFPVWIRNQYTTREHVFSYDVILFVANWPASRIRAWDTLLAARAIENSAYSVGVNRTGTGLEGIHYNGHSGVYNFKGEPLFPASDGEMISTVSLSHKELKDYREKFPVQSDADQFEVLNCRR